jgi:hypothetical protein
MDFRKINDIIFGTRGHPSHDGEFAPSLRAIRQGWILATSMIEMPKPGIGQMGNFHIGQVSNIVPWQL